MDKIRADDRSGDEHVVEAICRGVDLSEFGLPKDGLSNRHGDIGLARLDDVRGPHGRGHHGHNQPWAHEPRSPRVAQGHHIEPTSKPVDSRRHDHEKGRSIIRALLVRWQTCQDVH